METRNKLYSLVLEHLSRAATWARSGFFWFLGTCLVLAFVVGTGDRVRAENTGVYRFAVVNMADILKRAPQSAAESEKLEAKFSEREKDLATRQEELRKASDQFRRDLNTLSAAEQVERESRLRVRERDLKRTREDLREEVRLAKDLALNSLQGEVADAIEAIRVQKSIDIIFRESDYITASARVDVTDEVLKYLQQRFDNSQDAEETVQAGE